MTLQPTPWRSSSPLPAIQPIHQHLHPAFAGEAANALIQLENIAVKGRAPKTGYNRGKFGRAWADVDHNIAVVRYSKLAMLRLITWAWHYCLEYCSKPYCNI